MFFLYFLIISGLKIPIGTFIVLPAELGWSEELPGLWEGWSPGMGRNVTRGQIKEERRGTESSAELLPVLPFQRLALDSHLNIGLVSVGES